MSDAPDDSQPVVAAEPLAAIACAALADGHSEIRGLRKSPDIEAMLRGLAAVGVQWSVGPGNELAIRGRGGHVPLDEVRIELDSLAAVAALLPLLACTIGRFTLDCSVESDFPALLDALRDLHVAIAFDGEDGRFPVNLLARGLGGGRLTLTAAIWPMLPDLLVALPLAGSDVLIEMPRPSAEQQRRIDATLELMRLFGAETVAMPGRLVIPAPQQYRARAIVIAYT